MCIRDSINAVGAHSAAPRIPGIDSVNVADAWKVLAGEQQVYGLSLIHISFFCRSIKTKGGRKTI